jgi:hypothetical protein
VKGTKTQREREEKSGEIEEGEGKSGGSYGE